jgi:hypothetical protein
MGIRTQVVLRPHAIPALIAAVMLFAAIGRWPYGYYQVMRWIVCGAAVFTAYQGYATRHLWAAWVFGFAAALFNPIASVHLSRHTWPVIDLAVGVLFLVGIALVRQPDKNDGHAQEGENEHG